VNALARAAASELAAEMTHVVGGDVMRGTAELVRQIGAVKAAVAAPSRRDTLRAVALPLVGRARQRSCRTRHTPLTSVLLIVIQTGPVFPVTAGQAHAPLANFSINAHWIPLLSLN